MRTVDGAAVASYKMFTKSSKICTKWPPCTYVYRTVATLYSNTALLKTIFKGDLVLTTGTLDLRRDCHRRPWTSATPEELPMWQWLHYLIFPFQTVTINLYLSYACHCTGSQYFSNRTTAVLLCVTNNYLFPSSLWTTVPADLCSDRYHQLQLCLYMS